MAELTYLDADICKAILSEYKIPHAEVMVRDDCTADEFIDVIEGIYIYIYMYVCVCVCLYDHACVYYFKCTRMFTCIVLM